MKYKIKGFTLIETIIVISVLGLLAALIIPRMTNILPVARDQDAIARAYTLNTAMFTYSKRVGSAATNWSAADNAGKYALLSGAGYLPGCPTTLVSFQPSGYTFTFPSVLTNPRVSITGPNGAVSYN